jgi:uncharacterized Zn-finger protein
MFKCDICNKEFTRKYNLKIHNNIKVCNNKKYKCKYCNNRFTSSISMYRHIKVNCIIKKETDRKKKIYI